MKKKAVEKIINRSGYERRSSRRFVIFTAFIFAMVATLSFLMTSNMKKTVATDFSGFEAGNIISDAVMRNYISMTESEIQTFLDKHVSCGRAASGGQYVNAGTAYGVKYNYKATYGGTTYFYHVENGRYVCMNSEKFNGETAAHIIYSLAHQYHINPQVLLVLLEKEQGLVSDSWPNSNFQYRSATGFGCPDTAPCDSEYYGLRNQVESAAWLFDQVLSGGWTNYDVGNNWIRFSPNAACGGSWVNIENKATAALYRYTPYQPNAAAIKNYPGGATCGAYGNRNFYAFFTDWFGSTQKVQYTFVQNYYNKNKNKTGNIVGDTVCTDQTGKAADFTKDGDYNCYQDFDKGTLFWNTNIKGSIRTESDDQFMSKENAVVYKVIPASDRKILGKMMGNVVTIKNTDGSTYQILPFENGYARKDNNGYKLVKDPMISYWSNYKIILGNFVSETTVSKATGTKYLECKNAYLVTSDDKNYFIMSKEMFSAWTRGNNETLMGKPTDNASGNGRTGMQWQGFENGFIMGNNSKGWYPSTGKTREVWGKSGWENGKYGFIKSDIIDGCQLYYGGKICEEE